MRASHLIQARSQRDSAVCDAHCVADIVAIVFLVIILGLWAWFAIRNLLPQRDR